MFRFNLKRSMVLGISSLAVSLSLSGTADAGPPPGMRWSDSAGLNGPRGTSQRMAMPYSVPAYPAVAAPATTVMPGVAVAPGATTAPGMIAVRGPDGIVRNFPLASGSGIAQRLVINGQVMTAIRTAEGAVQYVPVEGGTVAPGAIPAMPNCR